MSYTPADEFDYQIAADPEAALQINRELNLARRIVEETGTNLFLTGKAGTGKTTFLRHLSESTRKKMVILAPTGVAAINAGGMTLHSFFQLPFAPFVPGKGFIGEDKRFYRMSKEKRRLIAALDLIVIDEISMVRPDLLDGIDDMLRRMRGSNAPFGGIQLLLIGDIRQLAPVVRENEHRILRDIYPSNYFFDSIALKKSGFVTVELRTIYRQQDPRFINLLNAVRDGKAGREELNILNRLCINPSDTDEDNTIRLTTHNSIADRINSLRLAVLPGYAETYNAIVQGKFPEYSYPADFTLTLKEGARVMFIKNDSGSERKFYNGMIGTVIELGEQTVTVAPDENPQSPIEVGYVEWENNGYEIDEETKNVVQTIEGTFSQIPLRLAWAITIHKSQGLTFDRAIIDASKSFAPGQLYVALSRCRSLEGMRLESRLTPESVIIDTTVNNFIEISRRNAPDQESVKRMRDEYCRMLLAEVFNFYSLAGAFREFTRYVKEYVAPIYPRLFDNYRDAETIFTQKIESVGQRFIRLYTSGNVDADTITDNQTLIEKIRNGCRYFLEQLEPVCNVLNDTPTDIDNTAYARRLDNAADILAFEMRIKKHILKGFLTEPFSPSAYMKLKTNAVIAATAPTKPLKSRTKKNTLNSNTTSRQVGRNGKEPGARKKAIGKEMPKLKKPKGYSVYETLSIYKETGSLEAVAKQRNLRESTVVGHLVELINKGELEITDVLPSEVIDLLNTSAGSYDPANSDITLYRHLANLHPNLEGPLLSLYTRTRK